MSVLMHVTIKCDFIQRFTDGKKRARLKNLEIHYTAYNTF